jgi:predicted naringenin-chalcone synthase
MTAAILGLGTALPSRGVTQQRAAEHARARCCETAHQERLLATLYRRSGVARRQSVVVGGDQSSEQSRFFPLPKHEADIGPTTAERLARYAADAPQLAHQAARSALDDAAWRADHITHLVTVSCTGFSAPGFDIALMKRLGLSAEVQRTHVGFMGCHGALNGLRVASAMADAQPGAVVLLCAVELCSLHFGYGWNSDRVVANALFGDGAAAAVIAASPVAMNGRSAIWSVRASGSAIVPDSEDAMTWTIGDHGFEMTLSPAVPNLIEAQLPSWLDAWLDRCGVTRSRIASWAVHPGGPRILDAVQTALALPSDALDVSRSVLNDFGNMSSPTLMFILERLRSRRSECPCVALAFGPGLTIEAALLG